MVLFRPAETSRGSVVDANSSHRPSCRPPSTRASLLSRLRTGADVDSWRSFVDLYTPLIFRYSRRRGLQDADAQDVVQQVLTSIHRAIGHFQYDPSKGRFRQWLGLVTSR